MTILKALKDRIRSMGGETNATNIADAIKDLPKGGSSELPPEVSNAVETHGMGWTDEDETVHQIDSKYIPSSVGGAVVVTFGMDEEENVTADKTVEEVKTAMLTNCVVGVLNVEDTLFPLGIALLNAGDAEGLPTEIGFVANLVTTAGNHSLKYMIYSYNDEWKLQP